MEAVLLRLTDLSSLVSRSPLTMGYLSEGRTARNSSTHFRNSLHSSLHNSTPCSQYSSASLHSLSPDQSALLIYELSLDLCSQIHHLPLEHFEHLLEHYSAIIYPRIASSVCLSLC